MYLHVSIMKLFTMLASFFYTEIHIYYLLFFFLFCFISYVDSIVELLLFRKKNEMRMALNLICPFSPSPHHFVFLLS